MSPGVAVAGLLTGVVLACSVAIMGGRRWWHPLLASMFGAVAGSDVRPAENMQPLGRER